MQTAAAYVRVSTEDQVEYSPDSQIKAIQKYAKDHDMILPQEFIFADEGISGRKALNRPAFQRMIGLAKTKPRPFDVILLWKFSRFARNREDSIVYKSMLRKQCGIDVVSISEHLGEDKTAILIEALLEAMDEYYSINLSEEVKRGMIEKFNRGEVTARPPLGYAMVEGKYVIQPEGAEIVRRIYAEYLAGVGQRAITRGLTAGGVKTKKGFNFDQTKIQYILTNPVYTGKVRRKIDGVMQVVPGLHEPIIDQETFDRAQERRREVERIYGKFARTEENNRMLKGVLRCGNCGGAMVAKEKGARMQCAAYGGGACQQSHSIGTHLAEAAILGKLREDLQMGVVGVEIAPPPEPPKKSEDELAAAMLKKEQKKLERAKEAYTAGVDTLQEYKEQKAKIQARILELEERIEACQHTPEQRSREIVRRIQAGLAILEDPDASGEIKNKTLRGLVERIIFHRQDREHSHFEIIYRDPFA